MDTRETLRRPSMEVKPVLLDKMKRLLADEPDVVHECRRCGASLGANEDTCPECGSTESAQFVIS